MNQREMNQHIEFEPTTYYAAFSAELEASASPMWALVSHLKDASTAHLTKNLLWHCKRQLRRWLENVKFGQHMVSINKLILHFTWNNLLNNQVYVTFIMFRMKIFKYLFIFRYIDTFLSSFTKLFGIKDCPFPNFFLLHTSLSKLFCIHFEYKLPFTKLYRDYGSETDCKSRVKQ